MSSPEGKEHGASAAEETGQVSSKKEKKSRILRSLKKLTSPNNKSEQGKKKLHEREKSVKANEDAAKKIEQLDKGESPEQEETKEEETPAVGKNKECSNDNEETTKAVKRKTSDLNNIGRTRALKRKKEDDENINENQTDVQDYDEGDVGEDISQQHVHQDGSEENSALRAEKTVRELIEEKEKCIYALSSQANSELLQKKNNKQEETENKESEVKDEIQREWVARDDTQDEENEARELSGALMKAVIEFKEEKETQKAEGNDAQVEKIEENVEPSTEKQEAVITSQMGIDEGDDKDGETSAERQDMGQETDDELSSDSDMTVISLEQLPTYKHIAEHQTEPKIGEEGIRLKHEGVSKEIETSGLSEPREEYKTPTEDAKEYSETEISQVTESPVEEADHKTEDPEEFSEANISHEEETEPNTEDFEVVESKAEDSTERKAEDTAEMRDIHEGVSSESKLVESKAENKTEPKAEDTEEMRAIHEGACSESKVVESKAEDKTESKAEDNGEVRAIEQGVSSEREILQVADSEDKTEPKTEDAEEIQAIHEGVCSESEVVESTAEAKPEPKIEDAGEIRVSNEKPSSKTTNEGPKISDKLLQRRMVEVLLTEPEKNEESADAETTRKGTKQGEKKENGADKEKSDSLSNNSATWIVVQHLEMNEDVIHQLGRMLTFNAFKRTTSCCAIM